MLGVYAVCLVIVSKQKIGTHLFYFSFSSRLNLKQDPNTFGFHAAFNAVNPVMDSD